MKTVVDHLQELIAISSVSNVSNRAVTEYCRATLQARGWTAAEQVHRDDAGMEKVNLIAAPPGQNAHAATVDLAFVCHTDTVPYSNDWKEATQPAIKDGAVHGCGACDVKGFLACLLQAASEQSVEKPSREIRIVLTADEEIGCRGAHRLLAAERLRTRQMVIGEPTSLHPARAGKGYCLAEVTVLGAEAHSALPHQGRSAILDAARLITQIEVLAEQLQERQNSFFTPAFTTLNIGTIHGGTAKNIVAGQCSFLLEWRPIPWDDAAASVPEAIAGIVQRMQQTDPGFQCEVTVLRQQAGFETAANAELVVTLETMNGCGATAIAFGSEASVLQAVADEVVVWGPGDMRTAHSPRECVPVRELHEAVRCIRALMTRA